MHLTSARLPIFITLALAFALVSTTAWQGYSFWKSEAEADSKPNNLVQRETATQISQAPKVSLSTLQLFGNESPVEQTAVEENIEDLPETNLKLTLRGVLAADGDFPGSALVEDDKRKTEAYLVGDELPGNARLKTVRADRIIIDRSGKLENLYFPEDEDREGISFAANDTSPQPEPTNYAEPAARPASYPGPAETSATSDARREEIRRRLEQLRNRLRNNN